MTLSVAQCNCRKYKFALFYVNLDMSVSYNFVKSYLAIIYRGKDVINELLRIDGEKV